MNKEAQTELTRQTSHPRTLVSANRVQHHFVHGNIYAIHVLRDYFRYLLPVRILRLYIR